MKKTLKFLRKRWWLGWTIAVLVSTVSILPRTPEKVERVTASSQGTVKVTAQGGTLGVTLGNPPVITSTGGVTTIEATFDNKVESVITTKFTTTSIGLGIWTRKPAGDSWAAGWVGTLDYRRNALYGVGGGLLGPISGGSLGLDGVFLVLKVYLP